MKSMNIKEIQSVGLEIMKDIHVHCVTHGIEYTLAYGSLIGAIRHKGYIPWDDDIDVWMTRPNFEKFCNTYQSKKGYRLSMPSDKDSLLLFGRVYETNETVMEHLWRPCKGDIGVWVDICPLDGIPECTKERDVLYKQILEGKILLDDMRHNLGLIKYGSIRQKVANVKLLINSIIKHGSCKSLQSKIVKLIGEFKFDETNSCCYYACNDAIKAGKQEILDSKYFYNYKLTDFEDTQFLIVEDYDALLKDVFGDYMQLPPVDKQTPRHGNFCWINK